MSTILLCASPFEGHVTPILEVATHLKSAGHRVCVLTGSTFASRVDARGLEFVALSGSADLDEKDLDTFVPDRDEHRGLSLAAYQIQRTFIDPIPDQCAAVRRLMVDANADAILCDAMFVGVLPILLQDRADRIPILALGVSPLSQASRDVAPYNSGIAPSATTLGRMRNRLLNRAGRIAMRSTQKLAEAKVAEAGGPPLTEFVMDVSARFDRYLQLGPAEFEYPRSDLTPNVRFVGALGLDTTDAIPLPDWWDDLHDGRRVVHVTQGTLVTDEATSLIDPTVAALADSDVHLVVSTSGRPMHRLPDSPLIHVADYIPHADLFPITDVFVTNGGYGAVLKALGNGVPVVVAPSGEDKPEVAAHVEYFGVGIDLGTGRPTPDRLRSAIDIALADEPMRARTRALAQTMRGQHPLDCITAEIEQAIAT